MSAPPTGAVFIAQGVRGAQHRRVIAVLQDRVFYSCGGDRNGSCKLATWRRWALRAEAYPS